MRPKARACFVFRLMTRLKCGMLMAKFGVTRKNETAFRELFVTVSQTPFGEFE